MPQVTPFVELLPAVAYIQQATSTSSWLWLLARFDRLACLHLFPTLLRAQLHAGLAPFHLPFKEPDLSRTSAQLLKQTTASR